MGQLEFDFYIPPDTTIDDDGEFDSLANVYEFDDRVDRFLQSFTGLGMPPINYIRQSGPYQHGETVIDYRLGARTIQLVHRRLGNCREDYWANRADIINFLRPNRQTVNSFDPARLRKILPNGDVRDIYVYLQSGPAFTPRNIGQWDEFSIQETLRFTAYDPILFDPVLKSAVWSLGSFENLIFYESPDYTDKAIFPIWFGLDSISNTLSITYNGTWFSYPTIEITGPINSPQINNLTTGESIKLEYDIAAGESVKIDLNYGKKTVINNFGINLIGTASTDSDLATFHIAADPEAVNGVNELQAVGNNAVSGVTEIKVSYYERYIGV